VEAAEGGNTMNRHPRPRFVPALLITLGLVLRGCASGTTHGSAGARGATGSSASTSTGTAESKASPAYTLIDPAVEYDELEAGGGWSRPALDP
jgi:hypothetical protein